MSLANAAHSVVEPSAGTRRFAGSLVVLYAIVTMIPLVWIVLTSFKSPDDAISYPPKILFTPSLDLPVLAGVTRATLRELAPGLGYEVEEGAFALDQLLASEEIFLSSSVREVMPVIAVDGAETPRGPAAAALQAALRAAAGYPKRQ